MYARHCSLQTKGHWLRSHDERSQQVVPRLQVEQFAAAGQVCRHERVVHENAQCVITLWQQEAGAVNKKAAGQHTARTELPLPIPRR